MVRLKLNRSSAQYREGEVDMVKRTNGGMER